MFQNRVLRRMFGPKGALRKKQNEGEISTVRSFITCTLHQIFLR
jgi:hypothetical protein